MTDSPTDSPTGPRTPPLRVRQPRVGEAAELARVHVTTWRQAYQGKLPERFWNDQALAKRMQMWSNVLASQEHRSQARVTEAEGEITGIAMAGTPRDHDVDVETELFMMYLLAEHYGSGAADALLADLLGEASASLWVFEDNPRAHAFYRKHGFEPDGAVKDLGEERGSEDLRGIREIRMTRPRCSGA